MVNIVIIFDSSLTLKLETTYQILFAAARSSPPLYTPKPIFQGHSQTSQHQPSLHTFWPLPTPPSSTPQFQPPPSQVLPLLTCEDCDCPLLSPSDVDICMTGMDDMEGCEEFACRSCGRRVCGACAVVEVGVGRECLSCKTKPGGTVRETWIGGIGWMP